jgi:hypothetical protein
MKLLDIVLCELNVTGINFLGHVPCLRFDGLSRRQLHDYDCVTLYFLLIYDYGT